MTSAERISAQEEVITALRECRWADAAAYLYRRSAETGGLDDVEDGLALEMCRAAVLELPAEERAVLYQRVLKALAVAAGEGRIVLMLLAAFYDALAGYGAEACDVTVSKKGDPSENIL